MIEITYRNEGQRIVTNDKISTITYHGDGYLLITPIAETPFIVTPSNVILIRAATPPPIRRRRSHK